MADSIVSSRCQENLTRLIRRLAPHNFTLHHGDLSSRGSFATQSHSIHVSSGRISQNIPEARQHGGITGLFLPIRPNRYGSNYCTLISPRAELTLSPQQQPSLSDLCTIAADNKDTLMAAISDLCLNIQAIAGRVQEMEKVTAYKGIYAASTRLLTPTPCNSEISTFIWRIWTTVGDAIT